LSQGLIAAPSITHIIDTPVAQRRGWSAVVSMHRLLERIGHVSGPMLVGAALAAAGGDPIVIGLIGLLTIAAGILFVLIAKRPRLTSAASTDDTVLMTSSGD
jgi:hypothetical protein